MDINNYDTKHDVIYYGRIPFTCSIASRKYLYVSIGSKDRLIRTAFFLLFLFSC